MLRVATSRNTGLITGMSSGSSLEPAYGRYEMASSPLEANGRPVRQMSSPPANDVIACSDTNATQIVSLVHGTTTNIVDAVQQTTTDIVGLPRQATQQRHQNSADATCRASACLKNVVVASHPNNPESNVRKCPRQESNLVYDLRTVAC